MNSLYRYNVRTHARLDRLFLDHQGYILDRDPRRAVQSFERYAAELLEHMRHEEKVLLPLYRKIGEAPNAPVVFFTGEHKRMREFLRRIRARLHRLEQSDQEGRKDRSGRYGRWIALFDLESAYKNLVQHHDQREKSKLYPALGRLASEALRLIKPNPS